MYILILSYTGRNFFACLFTVTGIVERNAQLAKQGNQPIRQNQMIDVAACCWIFFNADVFEFHELVQVCLYCSFGFAFPGCQFFLRDSDAAFVTAGCEKVFVESCCSGRAFFVVAYERSRKLVMNLKK